MTQPSGTGPGSPGSTGPTLDDVLGPAISLAVAPEVAARIEALAVPFIEQLASARLGSAAFRRAIAAVDGLGDREIHATTAIARGFHDRPTGTLRGVLADDAPLSRNLRRLRRIAERFGQANVQGGTHPAEQAMAQELARAEPQLRQLVDALESDRQTLERDNASIAQQELALWTQIQTLRQYALLTARLDALLDQQIEAIGEDDPEHGRGLRDEAQYAVRRRRRDLLLQLAVATQGYAALRVIEQDNLDVIWAIRAATTTTVSALRTALFAGRALADRRLSGRVGRRRIEGAWDDVLGAVDEVDARKRKTLEEIAARPTG
jgi:hypothetical protein